MSPRPARPRARTSLARTRPRTWRTARSARASFSSSRADPAGRLRIRAKSLAGHEEVEHLSAKEEVLAIASDQLEIINHVNDARIFGVTADVSTVMSVVTAGLSAYVFIFFLLFEISTD